jgi:hypothetical protein
MNRDMDMINLLSTTPIIEDCLLCSVDNPCGFSNNTIYNRKYNTNLLFVNYDVFAVNKNILIFIQLLH